MSCVKLSKVAQTNYLVVFPKPQDVIRQLEIYALLSQILPWREEEVRRWLIIDIAVLCNVTEYLANQFITQQPANV